MDALFPTHPEITWEDSGPPMEFQEITTEELKSVAAKIPSGKAPGLDGVPDTIVKAVAIGKPEVMLGLFNTCQKEGVFPDRWKQANLVLLRKGDKPLDQPSSYRPIRLLDTVGKFFERIIKARLETHLETNNMLSDQQYGFCKGISTIDAVSSIMNEVTNRAVEPLHRRNLCAMISLDVSNAFKRLHGAGLKRHLQKKMSLII